MTLWVASLTCWLACFGVGFVLGRRGRYPPEPPRATDPCLGLEADYCTAIHEAGHVVCSWYDPFMDQITRVEIHSQGGVVVTSRSVTDRSAALWYRLVADLGGIAAEVKQFGKFRSGSSTGDLIRAADVARQLASRGDLAPPWKDPASPDTFDFSNVIRGLGTKEAQVLALAYARAKYLVVKDKTRLNRVAAAVMSKRVLLEEDVQELFGPRKPLFF